MARQTLSKDSLANATRSRAKFSGHGQAKGAAGHRIDGKTTKGEFLSHTGDTAIIDPHDHGYQEIRIGAAWEEMIVKGRGFLGQFFTRRHPVDLDLGCMYELQDGTRGAVQAFGDLYGAFDKPPYINHSGDERSGETHGDDEYILVNGPHWPDIKRLLIYVYIYDGVPHWASVRPQIQIFVPGEEPIAVVPDVHDSKLAVCALVGLENIRNGIKLTNYNEYFPGHAEMDRAFGFGLQWGDGQKA